MNELTNSEIQLLIGWSTQNAESAFDEDERASYLNIASKLQHMLQGGDQ